jgi:hypothetical protein
MSAQPLHPSIVPRLDPEYVEFHNKHIAQLVPPHVMPWNPVTRNVVPYPGASEPLDVGSINDISLRKCKIRVFTPPRSPSPHGRPVFIFFHGGQVKPDIVLDCHLICNLQADGHMALSAPRIRFRRICVSVYYLASVVQTLPLAHCTQVLNVLSCPSITDWGQRIPIQRL